MEPVIKVIFYILGVVLAAGLCYTIFIKIEIARLVRRINRLKAEELLRNKVWKWFIDEAKEMTYVGEADLATVFTYHNRYDINIWKDSGLASVHTHARGDCVLTTFNETESKLLADKLLESIKI